MKHLLIRADDLGYSEGVNYGIAKTVNEGLVRSVGFMVNMSSSAHGLGLIDPSSVCLGQHTNVCVGKPLSDPADIPSLTGADGMFRSSGEYRRAVKDIVVYEEALVEIEAQYRRFRELVGRDPDYFEGHAVVSDNLLKALRTVAERHGLKFSGFSFDGNPLDIAGKKVRVVMESMRPGYDPVGVLKKAVTEADDGEYLMFISHPGYLDQFILDHSSLTLPRAKEAEALCDPALGPWLREAGVELVTYRDL